VNEVEVTTTPDSGSDTTTVCYNDLVGSGLGDKVLLRLSVSAGSGGAATTATTGVIGYQMATIKDFCQSYSDPLLEPCLVTGTIGTVTPATRKLDLSAASGTQSLDTVLNTSAAASTYYLEVTSGENLGHIFDIESIDSVNSCLILADDSDLCAPSAPYSTQTSVPANLTGDTFVIREHKTLTDLFPIDDPATTPAVEGFATGANSMSAGRLLRYNRATGGLETYYASTAETWVTVSSGPGAPDQTLPPGEGIFVHNLAGQATFDILQFGEARATQLAVPLKSGYNFVAPGHPVVDQAIDSGTSNSRLMNADATGGKFTFTGDGARSLADQVQVWRDDDAATTAATAHLCYDMIFYLRNPGGTSFDQWSYSSEANPVEREGEALFSCTRSMIYCVQSDKLDYYIPSPINNLPVPINNN